MTAIFVSREVAAQSLSISVPNLDRLVLAGRLQAVKLGRRVLFSTDVLHKFARQLAKESQ
jgi:excisionase family DNA binding protein